MANGNDLVMHQTNQKCYRKGKSAQGLKYAMSLIHQNILKYGIQYQFPGSPMSQQKSQTFSISHKKTKYRMFKNVILKYLFDSCHAIFYILLWFNFYEAFLEAV